MCSNQSPGSFLGIVSQDPSDSKSSRLHVDIIQFYMYICEQYVIRCHGSKNGHP